MTVRKAIVIPLASAHTELILATRFYESRVQNVKHAIVLFENKKIKFKMEL